MKQCECGRISRLERIEARGSVVVYVYECRTCGAWEDYRVSLQPTLTPDVLAARHECHKAKERVRARKRYHARKGG